MDPSQAQSDSKNDVHSLEHEEGGEGEDKQAPPAAAGGSKDGEKGDDSKPDADGVTDATSTDKGKTAPPDPFKHRSFIKRLWDKFNIYLMLFIFVIVIAVGALVSLTIKGQKDLKTTASQELSQDALKQLADTDVTVGNPKQILTVQANAVFAGAVLVRGSLEVAGDLKLGGDLSLADLTVSGDSKLNDVTATNLTVGSNLNLQGTLTLKSGISVAGQGNFTGGLVASSVTTGALQLNGDLRLTHHIAAGGTIPGITKGSAVGSGGTVSLSGSDTSGSIIINTGSSPPAGCFATVTFSQPFDTTPHVVVSPVSAGAADINYYVTRSTTGFVLCGTNAAGSGQSFGFDYVVLA